MTSKITFKVIKPNFVISTVASDENFSRNINILFPFMMLIYWKITYDIHESIPLIGQDQNNVEPDFISPCTHQSIYILISIRIWSNLFWWYERVEDNTCCLSPLHIHKVFWRYGTSDDNNPQVNLQRDEYSNNDVTWFQGHHGPGSLLYRNKAACMSAAIKQERDICQQTGNTDITQCYDKAYNVPPCDKPSLVKIYCILYGEMSRIR